MKVTCFLILITVWGCRQEKIQLNEKFVNLYVDLQLVTLGNQNNPSRAEESRRVVLKQYSMNSDTYTEELSKIMKDPKAWTEFQTRVLERIDEAEKLHKGE